MKLRIGTRRSTLSMVQAELVMSALKSVQPGITVEIVEMSTMGDRKQGTPAASRGEKRDWIHELELAVTDGSVDLAVHSGKDVPALFDSQTELLPLLKRASAFDVFIGKRDEESGIRIPFNAVPEEGLIGCASLRRRAQLLRLRPDLKFREHRGNVTTRLENLESSKDLDGIVLAQAGLDRLGLFGLNSEVLAPSQLVPAINQGMLVGQFVSTRPEIKAVLLKLVDPDSRVCFDAERACVTALNADCHSSVGIYAVTRGKRVHLTARVLSVDGKECVELSQEGRAEDAKEIGSAVATGLLNRGAARLILQASRVEAGHNL